MSDAHRESQTSKSSYNNKESMHKKPHLNNSQHRETIQRNVQHPQHRDLQQKDTQHIKSQFTESQYSAFARLYTTHVSLFKKKRNLQEQLKSKLKTQNILKQCILEKEANNLKKTKSISKDISQKEFTFSLTKSSDTFFELVDLGQLPTTNFEKYHTKEYIYPIGYIAKRFYSTNTHSKILYTCKILENCFLIESEEGQIWKGLDMWTNFVNNFDNSFEFKTFEHFFGLSYKNIQLQIEKLGDISVFVNYVTLDERTSNNNK